MGQVTENIKRKIKGKERNEENSMGNKRAGGDRRGEEEREGERKKEKENNSVGVERKERQNRNETGK